MRDSIPYLRSASTFVPFWYPQSGCLSDVASPTTRTVIMNCSSSHNTVLKRTEVLYRRCIRKKGRGWHYYVVMSFISRNTPWLDYDATISTDRQFSPSLLDEVMITASPAHEWCPFSKGYIRSAHWNDAILPPQVHRSIVFHFPVHLNSMSASSRCAFNVCWVYRWAHLNGLRNAGVIGKRLNI